MILVWRRVEIKDKIKVEERKKRREREMKEMLKKDRD